MDERIEIKIGAGFPERPQGFRIERLILQFRADDDAGKAKLDGAAFQLGRSFRGLERRHVRKPDEAAGMRLLRFAHAVVDLPADREIGLIEARAAGKHAGIDAGVIHHADMRVQIGEQRIEQIIRIAIAIEVDRDLARIALEQFRRRVVLLEVDEHGGPYVSFRGRAKRGTRNPYPRFVIMDSGLSAARKSGMTLRVT